MDSCSDVRDGRSARPLAAAAFRTVERECEVQQLRLGIDVACRESHRAALADETGKILWSNRRFHTVSDQLEALWAAVRAVGDAPVVVVMEPTRNAWAPLAAWLRARGATVQLVPSEQSADLRRYYNKHAKTDRLDCELLARLPSRRLAPGQGRQLDQPVQPLDALLAAARETLRLWPDDTIDFAELAEDIAVEARLVLQLNDEIDALDDRIATHYEAADPNGIVLSAPGVGPVLAASILGRLGDSKRFRDLAAVRNYTGLVPKVDQSGVSDKKRQGLTKAGDPVLRLALFMAADHARKTDPTLAARYYRLREAGKHHNSALCTLAGVLITRIAACWRDDELYVLRDLDGNRISDAEGREICVAMKPSPTLRAVTGTGRRSKESQSAPSTGPSTSKARTKQRKTA